MYKSESIVKSTIGSECEVIFLAVIEFFFLKWFIQITLRNAAYFYSH